MIKTISELRRNIIVVGYKSQYDLTSTFMRLQEFYESPFQNIRNCYFSLEQFMDVYADYKGNFTYTSDFAGFNIPDYAVRNFFSIFKKDLLEKEKNLYKCLNEALKKKKFYLIGICEEEKEAIDHELAHGYYYLDSDYKNAMDSITDDLHLPSIDKYLRNNMYANNVFKDETQAYLSTDSTKELSIRFNLSRSDSNVKKYRKVFRNKENSYK